jgi:hypothetical protein
MKENETFSEYVLRLVKCKELDKTLRKEAAKRLVEMWNNGKTDKYNKKIKFVRLKEDPCLSELFVWEKTKEGKEYWQSIFDKGF